MEYVLKKEFVKPKFWGKLDILKQLVAEKCPNWILSNWNYSVLYKIKEESSTVYAVSMWVKKQTLKYNQDPPKCQMGVP